MRLTLTFSSQQHTFQLVIIKCETIITKMPTKLFRTNIVCALCKAYMIVLFVIFKPIELIEKLCSDNFPCVGWRTSCYSGTTNIYMFSYIDTSTYCCNNNVVVANICRHHSVSLNLFICFSFVSMSYYLNVIKPKLQSNSLTTTTY